MEGLDSIQRDFFYTCSFSTTPSADDTGDRNWIAYEKSDHLEAVPVYLRLMGAETIGELKDAVIEKDNARVIEQNNAEELDVGLSSIIIDIGQSTQYGDFIIKGERDKVLKITLHQSHSKNHPSSTTMPESLNPTTAAGSFRQDTFGNVHINGTAVTLRTIVNATKKDLLIRENMIFGPSTMGEMIWAQAMTSLYLGRFRKAALMCLVEVPR